MFRLFLNFKKCVTVIPGHILYFIRAQNRLKNLEASKKVLLVYEKKLDRKLVLVNSKISIYAKNQDINKEIIKDLKKERAGIKRSKKSIKNYWDKEKEENVKLVINDFPVKKPPVPFKIENLYSDDLKKGLYKGLTDKVIQCFKATLRKHLDKNQNVEKVALALKISHRNIDSLVQSSWKDFLYLYFFNGRNILPLRSTRSLYLKINKSYRQTEQLNLKIREKLKELRSL